MKNILKPIFQYFVLSGCMINICQAQGQSFNRPAMETRIETIGGNLIVESILDKFIRETMDSLGIPGISIAIVNDAKIVYHRAFGVTNLETGTPVTKNTIFEAASLSKPIFAYFTLKMIERKILGLDKPLYPILKRIMPPESIEKASIEDYKTLTPRIILSHGTGIPNWAEGKPIHIAFRPGTGFSYSGEAYQHLGAAIGTKLGIGWESRLDSVFQQEVAIPIGLKHTYFTWNEYIQKNKATGHQNGRPTNALEHGNAFGPGYSLHTEAGDYARFLMEMINHDHLDFWLWKEMLKEQNKFKPDNELLEYGQTGWGLGFARRPTVHGLRYMHTGNNHDFQSYACFYPEKKYGLVLFINDNKLEAFFDLFGKFIDDEF